jgi:hypothetical protein
MLLEVVELPRKLLDVEGGVKADRPLRHFRGLALGLHDLVDGLAIQIHLLGGRGFGEHVLEGEVAQILLFVNAQGSVMIEELRHGQTHLDEGLADRIEGRRRGIEGVGIKRDDR